MSDDSNDLLSISEAAEALKVSVATLKRWISSGRLPAYHLGPRKVRIRRADLDKVLTPVGVKEAAAHYAPATVDRAWIEANIKPYTPEEREQLRKAIADAAALRAEMLERRGGVPFPESWPMIRRAREDRSRKLLGRQ